MFNSIIDRRCKINTVHEYIYIYTDTCIILYEILRNFIFVQLNSNGDGVNFEALQTKLLELVEGITNQRAQTGIETCTEPEGFKVTSCSHLGSRGAYHCCNE